jgi:hypothetical protein
MIYQALHGPWLKTVGMNLIGKIFEKLNFSFVWKGNKSTVIKQSKGEVQVHQSDQSITNIYRIENVTVNKIEELADLGTIYDPENLLKAAGQRFLIEQHAKQKNFKEIVDKAQLDEIEEPKEVDQDWFLKWMEISEGVSKEKVQDILARILSREVRKPNTFSLRTLEVIKNLSKEELNIFQKFCNISFGIGEMEDAFSFVICDPFGKPANNGLSPIGLSYSVLTILQDAGLIKSDLNSWQELPIQILQMPFKIGSTSISLKAKSSSTATHRFTVINFTTAGLELRSVLSLGHTQEYFDKFIKWATVSWHMEIAKDMVRSDEV